MFRLYNRFNFNNIYLRCRKTAIMCAHLIYIITSMWLLDNLQISLMLSKLLPLRMLNPDNILIYNHLYWLNISRALSVISLDTFHVCWHLLRQLRCSQWNSFPMSFIYLRRKYFLINLCLVMNKLTIVNVNFI